MKGVRHMFSLIWFKCYCFIVCCDVFLVHQWPNDQNHLLSCFVEYWRRWPECVSAVMLRFAAECFVCNIMVVVEGEKF